MDFYTWLSLKENDRHQLKSLGLNPNSMQVQSPTKALSDHPRNPYILSSDHDEQFEDLVQFLMKYKGMSEVEAREAAVKQTKHAAFNPPNDFGYGGIFPRVKSLEKLQGINSISNRIDRLKGNRSPMNAPWDTILQQKELQ